MKFFATLLLVLVTASAAPDTLARQTASGSRVRIYTDHAHGQAPLAPPYAALAAKLGAEILAHQTPITVAALEGYRLAILRAPLQEINTEERAALVGFVRQGGSLLLVVDEESRTSLATTRVNELIAPFGLTLTADTPYLHNNGAVAKKGTINAADRELPYSGGRAVEGGQAFAWQLDKDGKPAQVFGALTVVGAKGRVVVLAEGMASLFMGQPDGVRLTGVPRDPSKTTYWGKDSAIFMEELLTWLIG
jgi:hypothetical protein